MKESLIIIDHKLTFVNNPTGKKERLKDPTLKYKLDNDKELLNAYGYIIMEIKKELTNRHNLNFELPPQIKKKSTDTYFMNADSVLSCLKNRIIITDSDKDRIITTVLYDKYTEYRKTQDKEKEYLSRNGLYDRLRKDHGHTRKKAKINGTSTEVFLFMKLRTDYITFEDSEKEHEDKDDI